MQSRFVIAKHYIGEDIRLYDVTANSALDAALKVIDSSIWEETPDSFEQLRQWYWDQCEEYISVMEVN